MQRQALIHVSLLVLLLSMANESVALGKFSRACRLSEIPTSFGLRTATILLAQLLSTRPDYPLDYLQQPGYSDFANNWVHESITTDYGSARYYLYAEHWTWFRNCNSFNQCWNQQADKYSSNGWVAETVPQPILLNQSLSIFFANRAFLYSARAGWPGIILRWYPGAGTTAMYSASTGRHYYSDPAGNQQVFLGSTVAYDCNLSQWGFGDR